MANLCEKSINACIAVDCNNPLFAGVDSEGLIFNKSQIADMPMEGNIVTAIIMGSDSSTDSSYCGYTCQQYGNNPFEGSQVEMTVGTYFNKFNNTIQLAILNNGPEVCENVIDNFANGRFVVMLKNEYTNESKDNKHQLYGTAKGLKASSITRELYGDNESAYIVTLVEEGNPKSGVFFYAGSDASTEAAIAALKCPCEQ